MAEWFTSGGSIQGGRLEIFYGLRAQVRVLLASNTFFFRFCWSGMHVPDVECAN